MRLVNIWIMGFFLLFPFRPTGALDIPLSGGGPSGEGGAKIGYVDMDRIFQIYPQTLAAKEDYAKQLQKKRQQLAEKEEELANIKSRISVLESTLKTMGAAPTAAPDVPADSTGTVDAPIPPVPAAGGQDSQALTNMKIELVDKQVEYEELRKQSADDLAAFQNRQSQIILGKIYQALRDLVAEEQITLVVDKSSILYGSADVDLTERLQQRERGY